MNKLITIMICAILSIGVGAAQNTKTYTGYVVDANGNPVVGAEVMAPGGGASAITDSDGSFTIEVPALLKTLTASYAGMKENKIQLGESSNLIFRMKGLKKMVGFISVFGNIGADMYKDSGTDYYYFYYNGMVYNETQTYDYKGTSIAVGAGIMGGQLGQLGKWGWYLKGMGCYVTDDGRGVGSLTAGAIRRVSSKAHLYFGGGAAYVYDTVGFAVDLGAIFNVGEHLNIIGGLNFVSGKNSDEYRQSQNNIINFNIGVGYTF